MLGLSPSREVTRIVRSIPPPSDPRGTIRPKAFIVRSELIEGLAAKRSRLADRGNL
jgi:hypothetical protein